MTTNDRPIIAMAPVPTSTDVDDLTDIACAVDDLSRLICTAVSYRPDRDEMFEVLRTLRIAQLNLVHRHLDLDQPVQCVARNRNAGGRCQRLTVNENRLCNLHQDWVQS